MKNFNHQLPKHTRACASIASAAVMSWAFEGYNTPSISIRGNDQGLEDTRGFIEGWDD